MRDGESIFVDSGAWIALALVRDPYHQQARDHWQDFLARGARLSTSIPVILETSTFLARNATMDVALTWKDSLESVSGLQTLECRKVDLAKSWSYFRRKDLHKLSAVDATSFAIMTRQSIKYAFAFDHHFMTAGFHLVG